MSGESNFLSRWSRLKRRADDKRRGSKVVAPAPEPKESGMAAVPVAEGMGQPEELPQEELAALPHLEDLTPEADLTPFMRKGVPASLRNAALRRMWALDPTIRDRVGDALDYAYDWNIPGSVPGSGPLLPIDDVASMLRSIAGIPAEEEMGPDRAAEAQTPVAEASPAPQAVAVSPPQEPLGLDHSPATGLQASAPAPAEPESEMQANASSRRHGGATPF